MAEIYNFFRNRIISKGLWPPRSPDTPRLISLRPLERESVCEQTKDNSGIKFLILTTVSYSKHSPIFRWMCVCWWWTLLASSLRRIILPWTMMCFLLYLIQFYLCPHELLNEMSVHSQVNDPAYNSNTTYWLDIIHLWNINVQKYFTASVIILILLPDI